jgi:hypothetical protein
VAGTAAGHLWLVERVTFDLSLKAMREETKRVFAHGVVLRKYLGQ